MRWWTAAHSIIGDGVRCDAGGAADAYAGMDMVALPPPTPMPPHPLQHPTLTPMPVMLYEQQRGEQQLSGRVLSRESAAGELAYHDDACDDETERAVAAR